MDCSPLIEFLNSNLKTSFEFNHVNFEGHVKIEQAGCL